MDGRSYRRIGSLAGIAGILLGTALLAPTAMQAEETEASLSEYYGFEPLEIFKLERRSHSMLAGDLNHDGLTDLILVDNSHSRLDLLQQRREKPSRDEAINRSVNFIESSWRFEHRKISVDKEIASLALGDFNGDDRLDVAYFGNPDRLIVRYQPDSGNWTDRTSFRLPDIPQAAWNLAAGDLNGDGRTDLALLGKNETYLVYQTADGKLATPQSLMNTSENLSLARIVDIDGDGREDLCYVTDEGQTRTFCTRLQGADHQLGPELRFDLHRTRAVTLSNVDGLPGHEVLVIDAQTGRVKLLQLQHPEAESDERLPGSLIQYGFGRKSSRRARDLDIGDLDGDGLNDVVVTDPDLARMIVFRQHAGQGLDRGTPYAGLVEAEHVRLADFDGDKTMEVVVLSEKEKTIGLSRFEGNRLTFPQPLPTIEKTPILLEVADLDSDGRAEVVYVTQQGTGRSARYALQALRITSEGDWEPYLFDESIQVPLSLTGTPSRLVRLDANGDERPDFFIFPDFGRGAPQLLITDEKGIPSAVTERRGFGLASVPSGAVFINPKQQSFVLVAQGNYARSLRWNPGRQWEVVDQYNVIESNAKIVGAASLDFDGRDGHEIVLVDVGTGRARVLRNEENVFRSWKEIEIGSFPYKSLRTSDLNGDGRDDLLLLGDGKFGVLYAGRIDPKLKEIATFETKLEKVHFADLIAGDLNGDGTSNLAILDTRSHYVELLNFAQKSGLRHAMHFKLFEQKSFARANRPGSDPREALIADVTGDGRRDLILLTHDRVLLLPQDDGR